MKHIESILPEQVADELTRYLSDDATISSALKDLLHRDTGCVIPSLDNVPTSDIEEIIPLCLSILRRLWNTPLIALGEGTEKQSISELLRQLIYVRVNGNEALGIPLTNENIPAAVSALLKRRVDCYDVAVPDGLGMLQFLCSNDWQSLATKVEDTSTLAWSANSQLANVCASLTNCKKMIINCGSLPTNLQLTNSSIEELEFIGLTSIRIESGGYDVANMPANITTMPNLVKLSFHKLSSYNASANGNQYNAIVTNCQALREVHFGEAFYNTWEHSTAGLNMFFIQYCENIEEMYFGGMHNRMYPIRPTQTTKIAKVVFTKEIGTNANLNWWIPTNVLAERLDEFLSNFQTYIADRVADMTGKETLTLTLSSAVYAALEAQEGQTILATLANKNWNVAQA